MRELWKKTMTLAAIGFALGVLVGLGFLSITGVGTYYVPHGTDGLALYLALSGLLPLLPAALLNMLCGCLACLNALRSFTIE